MKHWTAGYTISSGFKVEYIDKGVPGFMIFDTEKEANDYFNDQRSDRDIMNEVSGMENLNRLNSELEQTKNSPMLIIGRIFDEGGISGDEYKLLAKYIKDGIKLENAKKK